MSNRHMAWLILLTATMWAVLVAPDPPYPGILQYRPMARHHRCRHQ